MVFYIRLSISKNQASKQTFSPLHSHLKRNVVRHTRALVVALVAYEGKKLFLPSLCVSEYFSHEVRKLFGSCHIAQIYFQLGKMDFFILTFKR